MTTRHRLVALLAAIVGASSAVLGGVPFLVGSLVAIVILARLHSPWRFMVGLAIATLVVAVPWSASMEEVADRITLLFLLLMSLAVAGALREARLEERLADDHDAP
jgi:hypothetical protein